MEAAKEVCFGCGAFADAPVIGLGKVVVEGEVVGSFQVFDICEQCWKYPDHRKTPLKMHFFDKSQREMALARAGSSNIG